MKKPFYYTLGIIALVLGILIPMSLSIYYPTPEKIVTTTVYQTVIRTTASPIPTTITITPSAIITITVTTPLPSPQPKPYPTEQGTTTISTPYTAGGEGRVYLKPIEGVPTFSSYSELLQFLTKVSNILNTYIPRVVTYTLAAIPLALPTIPVTKQGVESSRISTTNIQVEGVDELDIVKTNGRVIAVASHNKVFVVDVDRRGVASIININISGNDNIRGLFLVSNRLIIIVEHYVARPIAIALGLGKQIVIPTGITNTSILIYNIEDMHSPGMLSRYSITGRVLSARLVDNYVYLVTQLPLYREHVVVPLVNGVPIPVENIGIVDPLPNSYTNIMAININSLEMSVYSFLTGSSSWMYMSLERLYIAAGESYDIPRAYIELFKIAIKYLPGDIAKEISEALDIGNITRCYDTFTKYISSLDPGKRAELIKLLQRDLEAIQFTQKTRFYVFNVNGTNIKYRGSFSIPGVLLDQFAMEEMDKYFIVATTSTNITIKMNVYETPVAQAPKEIVVVECSRGICTTRTLTPATVGREEVEKPSTSQVNIYVYMAPVGETRNNVYTIRLNNLSMAGRLEGLAQGERVYAARLIKNTFFLVTFRNVDPLFAIDITDPEKPRVLGYLKIPGFSEYLHPIDKDRLLGIGVENNGLKISIFNISDPTRMNVISEIKIPNSWSPIFSDHHAFTLDPDYKTFYIPIWLYRGSSIIAISYKEDILKLKKVLDHENALRVVYIGNKTFTISLNSIKIFDAEKLEELGTILLQ